MADDELKDLLAGLFSDLPEGEILEEEDVAPERPDSLAKLQRHALYLRTASQISSVASSILELDELLPQAVDLIREEFGFYYVGIFLVDQAMEWAVLQAGTGEAGRQMIRDGHRLQIGDDSMIGWCVAHRQARIALDVGQEAVRFDNPFLPDTRSEMALPLVSRGRVIGAMTIQSTEPSAFSEEDVTILQAMADQLANAVENARLLQERQRRVTEWAIVSEIGQALATALRLDELLELVHQQVSRLFDTTNFYIATYREGEAAWTSAFHLEDGERQPRLRHSIESGLTGYIIRHRQPLLFQAEAENLDFVHSLGVEQIGVVAKSWLGVPLIAADKLVGVMAVQNYDRESLYDEKDLALFSTIAVQVAVALDNLRLLEDTRRQAREMEVINEVGRTVTSVLELDVVLRQVVDVTKARFGHYFVSIALVEGDSIAFRSGSTIGSSPVRLDPGDVSVDLTEGRGLIVDAVRTGQPVLVDDVLADPRFLPVPELPGTRSELSMPIEVKGRVIGVLDVQSDRLSAYGQTDLALLQSLASQVGVAIENARLFEERERRISELAIVNEIGRAAGSAPGLDALLEMVHERVSRLFDTTNFYVASYTEGSDEWTLLLDIEHGKRQPPATHKLGAGLTGHIIHNRRPILLRNRQASAEFHETEGVAVLGEPAQSWMGVPLIAADKVVGVMAIQSYEREDVYDEQDLSLFSTIAAQVASALDSLRLVEETRRRAAGLEVSNEVGQAITSVLDPDAVLRQIVDTIKEAFGYYFVGILLVEGDQLVFQYGSVIGDSITRWRRGEFILGLEEKGLTAETVRSGQPVLVNDVRQEPRYVTVEALETVQSELDIPIEVKGQVIGVLTVQSDQLHAFDKVALALLQSLASQAGVAIENARLFEEARRRATEFEVLHQVSLELTQEQQDLNVVLETITRRAMALLDSDGGGVWLWREEEQVLELVITFQVGEIDFTGRRLEPGEGLTGRAFAERSLQFIDHYPTWNGQSTTFHDAPFTSGLAAPMLWQRQVVGVLVVTRSEVGHPYTDEDKDLSELLAAQAAAVIQNARLFERTQLFAEEQAILRQITEAVSQSLEIQDLLDAVLNIVLSAMDLDAGLVSLHDRQTDDLYLAAEAGLPEPMARTLRQEGLAGTLCDFVFQRGETVGIDDVRQEAPIDVEAVIAQGLYTYVGALVTYHGERLGTICFFNKTVRPVSDRDLELLEAIGQQIGVGVQNAHLFAETQQRLQEVTMLSRVSQALASAPLQAEEIAEIVTRQFVEVMNVPEASISLPDPEDEGTMHTLADLRAQPIGGRAAREGPGTFLLADYPATVRAMETLQPLVVHASDPEADPAELAYMEEYETATLVIIPLAVKGQSIGVLELETWDEERPFTPEELNLAMTLANQAAVAFENARLFEETQASLAETEALYEAARSAIVFESVTETLQAVVNGVAQALPAERVAMFAVDLEKREIRHIVVRDTMEPVEISFEELWDGLAGWVLREGQPALSPKGKPDPRESPEVQRRRAEMNVGSILVAPVKYRERLLGVMTAINLPQQRDFVERDVDMIMALANQAAAAIENARLFEQAQDRARREQILREITARVRGSTDPDTIMRAAVREVGTALGRPAFIQIGEPGQADRTSTGAADGGNGSGSSKAAAQTRGPASEGGE